MPLSTLTSGALDDAVATARLTLARESVTGDNEAWRQYSLWIAARVMRAARYEGEATDALHRAHLHLQGVLDRIEDDASRASFLALPMNAAILAAVDHGVWPA